MNLEIESKYSHQYPGKDQDLLGQPDQESFNQSYLDHAPHQIWDLSDYDNEVEVIDLVFIVVIIVKPPVHQNPEKHHVLEDQRSVEPWAVWAVPVLIGRMVLEALELGSHEDLNYGDDHDVQIIVNYEKLMVPVIREYHCLVRHLRSHSVSPLRVGPQFSAWNFINLV